MVSHLSGWTIPLTNALGFYVLLRRLGPAILLRPFETPLESLPKKVSVIVPARNEAANLPILLPSLLALEGVELQIVVVDDQSTDSTGEIARSFADPRLLLVAGEARPEGWTGKNWACHQGFKVATGDWLLFTDADTKHDPKSLRLALDVMSRKDLDLLSAVPYHRCEAWWEKILGPYQLLVLISTAAFSRPRPRRLFAIGQYLLFTRESYVKQGGHEAIRGFLADDLELAKKCLVAAGKYKVEGRRLFEVRMYGSFADFVGGWRRIFRLGFRHASLWSPVEVFLVIAVLSASMRFFQADVLSQILMLSSLAIFAVTQRVFGNFSILGVVLLPWNLLLFTVISVLSVWDLLRNRELKWRGRSYEKTAD